MWRYRWTCSICYMFDLHLSLVTVYIPRFHISMLNTANVKEPGQRCFWNFCIFHYPPINKSDQYRPISGGIAQINQWTTTNNCTQTIVVLYILTMDGEISHNKAFVRPIESNACLVKESKMKQLLIINCIHCICIRRGGWWRWWWPWIWGWGRWEFSKWCCRKLNFIGTIWENPSSI